MKAKVIVPVLLLIISVFAGNWILGSIASRKLDERLTKLPDHIKVEYSELKVNPLWSSITLKKISYTNPNSGYTIQSEVLRVKMKYKEALEIFKNGKLESLSKLDLDFDHFKLSNNKEMYLLGEDMIINFDGYLSQKDLKALQHKFPDENQNLSINLQNAEVSKVQLEDGRMNGALNKLTTIKSAELNMALRPKAKRLDFERINIDAGDLMFDADVNMDYQGEGIEGFSAKMVDLRYNTQLTDGVEWGEEGEAKFTLQEFDSSFDGIFNYDEDGELKGAPEKAKFSLKLKDLGMQFEGSEKQQMEAQLSMLGLKSQDLFVTELTIQADIKDGRCEIKNTNLNLSVFEASLDAALILDENKVEGSDIEQMQMRISSINPKLNEAVSNLANTFGFKIPRDGDDILLEVRGSLSKPQVKGIHY